LHLSLRRWCGQTLCGFFFFAAPALAASASSRLRRLRVLLLPTRAASSGTARCVLSPSSSSPPSAPPAAPRVHPSSIARGRAYRVRCNRSVATSMRDGAVVEGSTVAGKGTSSGHPGVRDRCRLAECARVHLRGPQQHGNRRGAARRALEPAAPGGRRVEPPGGE